MLPVVLGKIRKADADYLEVCRVKRNTVEYDTAGAATGSDAHELYEFTKQLHGEVMMWLRKNYPELLP